MHTMVDWVSFSFEVGQGGKRENGWQWDDVEVSLRRFLPNTGVEWLRADDWKISKGRAPYAQSFQSKDNGVNVFWSGRLDHALCEITGRGAQRMTEVELLHLLLMDVQDRITRLDVASDLETDIEPQDFVAAGYSGRVKSRASYHTGTGSTEYIGSRSSGTFARVYRYGAPHPRSHLLRIEHELKKEQAQAAARWILEYGVSSVQASIGERMGWKHPLWKPDEPTAGKITVPRNDRSLAKTEIWLMSQAAPAFKKLVAAGLIDDPEAWLKRVFLEPLDEARQMTLEFL